MIRPAAELDTGNVADLAQAAVRPEMGGKAAGLAMLMAAGCNVPPGFVIAPPRGDVGMAMPEALRAEILSAHVRLGRGPVAVRCSGIDEDSEHSTRAGVFATHLNVVGEEALLAAILSVWRSAAQADGRAAAGVVVQRMLKPVAAGVMATSTPGDTGTLLIESAWGLGTTVVGGGPVDTFVASREGTILRTSVAHKPYLVRSRPEGGVETPPCPLPEADLPSLAPRQVSRLAKLGVDLERAQGRALEIEWALAGDELYLLQARPLPQADDWDAPAPASDHDLWSRLTLGELFPQPVTPFTWTLGRRHWEAQRRAPFAHYRLEGLRSVHFFSLFDCRLYFNVGAAQHLRSGRLGRGNHDYSSSTEAPKPHGLKPRAADLRLVLAHAPGLVSSLGRGRWRRRHAVRRFASARTTAERFRMLPLESVSAADLWRRFQALHGEISRLELIEAAVDEAVFGAGRWLELLGRRWLGNAAGIHALLGAAGGGEPAAIAPELVRIAARVPGSTRSELKRLPVFDMEALRTHAPELHSDVESFLAGHGHRASGELEWAQPRWREEPAAVLAALRAALEAPPGTVRRVACNNDIRQAAWEKVSERLAGLPGERLVPWRRMLLRLALARARRLMPLRSEPRDRVMLLFGEGRRILLALGQELTRLGLLSESGEIFLLTVDEIEAATASMSTPAQRARHRAYIRRRRLQLAKAALRAAPDLLGPGGMELQGPETCEQPGPEQWLAGVPAAPGRARGPVRVVSGPEDSGRVALGDVLVLAATDIGSTLLFPLASAMVLERGNLLSHAVVLAREFALPTVIQVPGAATALRDGMQVEVDGDAGRVRRLEAP